MLVAAGLVLTAFSDNLLRIQWYKGTLFLHLV